MSLHIKFDKMIVEMTKSKRFDNRCITVFNYFSRRYKHYYKYYSTKFNMNSTKISLFFDKIRQMCIGCRQDDVE